MKKVFEAKLLIAKCKYTSYVSVLKILDIDTEEDFLTGILEEYDGVDELSDLVFDFESGLYEVIINIEVWGEPDDEDPEQNILTDYEFSLGEIKKLDLKMMDLGGN